VKPFAKIEGAERINRALFKASKSLTRKVLLSGMRKAATPLVKAMRANIEPSGRDYTNARYKRNSGDLKKSIGKITGRSKKFPSIYVGPRVKRKWSNAGYVGHWVEFGNDTGYNVDFDGRRYAQKAFESTSSKAESMLEEEIFKAAMKFLK
jgi:hypothetical protein